MARALRFSRSKSRDGHSPSGLEIVKMERKLLTARPLRDGSEIATDTDGGSAIDRSRRKRTDYEHMTRPQLLGAVRRLEEQCGELKGLEALQPELDVRRAELEAQRHQLQEAQYELESSRDSYAELYDFAPVPYFTLDRNGLIKEAN